MARAVSIRSLLVTLACVAAASLVSATPPAGSFVDVETRQTDLHDHCRTNMWPNQWQTFIPRTQYYLTALGLYVESDGGFELFVGVFELDRTRNTRGDLGTQLGKLHCMSTESIVYSEIVCNAMEPIYLTPGQTYAYNMNFTTLDANNNADWSIAGTQDVVWKVQTACTRDFYLDGYGERLDEATDFAFSTYMAYDVIPRFKQMDYNFNIVDRNDGASSVIFFQLRDEVQSDFPFWVSSTEMLSLTGGMFVPHFNGSTGTFQINFFEPYSLASLQETSMTWIVYVMDNRASCFAENINTQYGCIGRARLHLNVIRAAGVSCPSDFHLASDQPTAEWTDISAFGSNTVENIRSWNSTTFPIGVTVVQYALTDRQSYQVIDSALVCSFKVYVSKSASISVVNHYFKGSVSISGLVQAAIVDYLVDASNIFTNSTTASPTLEFIGSPSVSGVSFHFDSMSSEFRINVPTGQQCRFLFSLTWCVPGFEMPTNATDNLPADIELTTVTSYGSANGFTYNRVDVLNQTAYLSANGMCIHTNGTSAALDGSSAFTSIVLSVYPKQPSNASSVQDLVYNLLDFSYLSVITEPMEGEAAVFSDPGPSMDITDRVPPVFTFCPDSIFIQLDPFQDGAVVNWETPTATDLSPPSITGTHTSGSRMLLKNSPYQVVYTALDLASLTSTCSFWVYLLFSPERTEVSATLPKSSIYVAQSRTQGRTVGVSNYLLRGTDPSDYSISPTISPATSQLRFTLASNVDRYRLKPVFASSSLSSGTTSAPVALASISTGEYTRLEVDMIWAAAGFKLTNVSASNVFSGLQLVGATTGNTVQDPSIQFGSDWFVSDSLSIIQEGSYIRIKGYSKPIADTFTFGGLQLSLTFPLAHLVDEDSTTQMQLLDSSYIRVTAYSLDSNVGVGSDALRVFDASPPTISNCPTSIVHWASEYPLDMLALPLDWADTTVQDDNEGSYLVWNNTAAEIYLLKTKFFQAVAYDAYGNTNVEPCVFSVAYLDNIPPTIGCPDNITVPASWGANHVNLTQDMFDPIQGSYKDNIDVPVSHVTPIAKLKFVIGLSEVSRTYSDAAQNGVTCITQVVVTDTQPPVITNCDPSLELESTNGIDAKAVWNTPVATDNSGSVSMTSPQVHSGDALPIGTTHIEYVATDPTGLSSTCSFTVTVKVAASSTGATSSSSSTSVIMGVSISAGVVALIVIVIFGVWNQIRRKAALRPQNFDDIIASLAEINRDGGKRVPREIKRPHVKILDVLGKGNFGEVTKGLLAEIQGTPGYLVAIKSLHPSLNSDRGAILQEAAIMAQFDHPYVVGLVGVVTVGEPLLVVIEYCEHGALNKYLESRDLSVTEKHMLAADCAEGLAYLASLNFVHRDIAARNVLVSSEKRAKISDFGMSRDTAESEYYQSKGGQLPVRWTAPEALEHHKFSTQSDIWSYGILLHEIWTKAALPYKGMSNQKVWVAVAGGYRLPCPEGCPQTVHDIMMACWKDSHERSSFEAMAKLMRDMESGLVLTSKESSSRLEAHDYIDFAAQRGLQSIAESASNATAGAAPAKTNFYASQAPPPSPTKSAQTKLGKKTSSSSVKSSKHFYDVSSNVDVKISTYEEPVVLSNKRPSTYEEPVVSGPARVLAVGTPTPMATGMLTPLIAENSTSSARQLSDPYIEVIGNSIGSKDGEDAEASVYDLASRAQSEDMNERRASSADDAELSSLNLSGSLNLPVLPSRSTKPTKQ